MPQPSEFAQEPDCFLAPRFQGWERFSLASGGREVVHRELFSHFLSKLEYFLSTLLYSNPSLFFHG